METILGENYWHGYVKVDFLDPWDGANLESYMAIDFIELAVNKDSLGGFGVNPEDRRFEEIRIGDIDGFGWGDGAALAAHNPAVASANDDLVNLPEKLPINRDGFGLLASGDFLPDIDADGAVDNSATGLEPGDDWDRRSGEEVAGTYYTGSGFTRSQVSYFPLGSQYTDITLSKSYSYSAEETDPVLTGDLARAFGPFPSADGHSATNGNTELVIDTDNDEIPDAVDPSNPGTILPGDVANHPFYFNFYVAPFAIDPAKPLYLTMTHGDLDTSKIEVELRDLRANAATATLMAAGTTDDGAIESSFVVLDETTLEFDDIFTWDAARNKWHGYLEVRFKNIDTATDEYFVIDFMELSTNLRGIGVARVPEDYSTIQEAINAALSEGTTILVAPGTYTENIDTGYKNLVLRSHDPLDPATVATTILDGNTDSGATDDGPVISLSGGQTDTSAVRGFTIQNGEAVVGGGIAGRFSGATIEHNVIEENTAAYGGGIALTRGLVRHNIIRNNEAVVDEVIDAEEPTELTGVGGGVYSAAELWANEIHDNSAVLGGGGIWDSVRPNASRLVNNLIHDNVVTDTSLANAPGAGVHVSEHAVGTILLHNTLVDNTWGVAGDVVNAIDVSELAVFRNNLLWDTTELSEAPDTDWDRLQGSELSFNGMTGAPDKGQDANWNFGDNPLFVNAATGDYRLQSSSPAIDAGRELTPTIPWDFAGALRVAATPDAGAFEKGNGGTAQQYVVILDIGRPTVGDAVTLTARLSPTLQAQVTGGATLTWQWKKNGTNIGGATNSTLTLDPVALSNGGGYRVVATVNAQAYESTLYALIVNEAEEGEDEEEYSSDVLVMPPRHLAFGFVPQYGEVTRTIHISNYSAATISGTAEITEGPFAIAFGTVPWTYSLAPGESTTIYLRAVPEGMGEFTGRLVFSTGEEVTMSCHTATNNAEGAEIAVYPSLVDFGYVAAEASEYRVVTVQNIGTELLEGMAIATAPFAVSPDEYSLVPGETTILTIGFHPDTVGDFDGQLTFSGGHGKSIALYGTSNAGSTIITDGIRINEVAPWNTWGIQDSYGGYSDWIEIYNENDQAVDLGGWTLTDDPANATSYPSLPTGTVIPAYGFLVVFATPEPSPPDGEFHTGFELDEVNGGHIGLGDVE